MFIIVKVALLRPNPTAVAIIFDPFTLQIPTEEMQLVLAETVNPTGGVIASAVALTLKLESIAKGEVTVRVIFEF